MHPPVLHNYYLAQAFDFLQECDPMDTLTIIQSVMYSLIPLNADSVTQDSLSAIGERLSPSLSTEKNLGSSPILEA